MVDGRVQQHDADKLRRAVNRPAERDDATPVVTERHDRTGEREGVGERRQVDDPLRERTMCAGAPGEAHVELIHCNNPPGGRSGLRGLHRARD